MRKRVDKPPLLSDNVCNERTVMAKKKSEHYIDNQQFFAAMEEWKELVDAANAKGEKHPPVTNYIGECFMKIAEHLSRKPNFINYPYRDEMISDGIENCLLYAYNFDPSKSKNPFSYFTQIIYYAFLRRIQKEKKQAYIKLKKIEMSDVDSQMKKWFRENFLKVGENFDTLPTFLTENDIESFEKKGEPVAEQEPAPKKAAKPKKPSKPKPKKTAKPAKKGKKK
jgi:hypothetical protein